MHVARLSVWVAATLLVAGLYGLSTANDDEREDRPRPAITLKQVPNRVKAAMLVQLLKSADDFELEGIQREREQGEVVYEAEFEIDDQEIELEIAADGRTLDVEISCEEDEDGEDAE